MRARCGILELSSGEQICPADLLNDSIFVLDEKGIITFLNPAAKILTGYQLDELLAHSFTEFIFPGDMALVTKKFQELKFGIITETEFRIVNRMGENVWIRSSSQPIFDEEGEFNGIVGVLVNIDARKQEEKTLLEMERLSAIGELASGVAHDFSNSLQIIVGNVELALQTPNIPEELADHLLAIKKCSSDVVSRIKQLQRFARKEISTERKALNLNALLDEAILLAKPLWKDEMEREGLEIDFQRNYGETGSIDGDQGELDSVFLNLLKNAIEAMPNGGTITLETESNENDVLVRIRDVGVGMSDNTRQKIFQPFFSTKGLAVGRGLGLSGAYSIIRDHGGNICVKETALGKGTTFEIVFPAGKIEVESNFQEAPSKYCGTARILWVDDEKEICELYKKQLEKLGHQADTAESGREAIRLLEQNQYDLLITDIGMPGMSGWQLAEAIKGKYGRMKVAVVSGWGASIDSEDKDKYGVGYILGKPISVKEVKNLVGEVLQLRHEVYPDCPD